MAEPTVNRVTLRREIAKDLGMPFFRRFPDGLAIQDTATSGLAEVSGVDLLRHSALTQPRDTWNSSWIWLVEEEELRRVVDFQIDKKGLQPEHDFDAIPSTASTFELFNIHTPYEIHDAINDAIIEGFPAFFDIVTDESIILEENKREYELVTAVGGRGVLSNPFRIKSIWIERIGTGGTFTPDTSSTTTTLVNSDLDLSDVDTGWSVSIFKNTGAGQYAVVSSVDTATGTITIPTLTTAADTSSSIRYWHRTQESFAWDEITAIDFNAKDYPDKMRIRKLMNDRLGLRFRIQYVGEPQTLSTDTAAGTVVPRKYIKHQAMAKLLRQRARTATGDIEKFAGLAAEQQQLADKFKLEHAFDLPDQTLWTEDNYASPGANALIFNPLDQ